MSNAPYSPPPYSSPQNTSAPVAPALSEAVFAPLPLRARGVLENLDLAFKLFKQYWKPLLAWGAVTNGLMLLALATSLSFLVGPPFIIGPVCCVLAAAVRGQNVGFKQCWGFSQPRVGNLLAMHLLSSLIAGAVIGALSLGLFVLAGWLGSALPNAGALPTFLFSMVVAVSISMVLSMGLAWQGMVSMVAAMEDEHRGVSALKRAWTLLRGRWKAALGLLTILNLALLVLWGMLWGLFSLLAGVGALGNAFSGRGGDSALIGVLGTIAISSWLIFTLFMPIYYLAQALFYLDARVRHEALDLEWNAHRTGEAAAQSTSPHLGYASASAPQSFFEPISAPGAPAPTATGASTGTWAPTPENPMNSAPPDATPFEAQSSWASADGSASPFAAPPGASPEGVSPPADASLHEPTPGDSEDSGASTWSGSSPFAPR